MIGLLLASALSLSGRCNYPVSLDPPLVGETRALCDSVAVRGDGADAVIEFAHHSTTQYMRFAGTMAGHRMTVRSVASTRVAERPARGSCNIFYKGGQVSAVSCVAQGNARSFVANFLVPQI
jgi:hypothetical protein